MPILKYNIFDLGFGYTSLKFIKIKMYLLIKYEIEKANENNYEL